MSSAAFFDLDETVCSRRTEDVFGRQLYREGEISSWTLLKILYTYLRYQLGVIRDYDTVKRRLVDEVFRGQTFEHIDAIWRRCYQAELSGSVPDEIKACIEDHLAAGRQVQLVSASLDFIAATFCTELGLHAYHASTLEARDGVYSGQILGAIHYGRSKGDVLSRLAESSGLDLQASYAYGDNIADRFMLEAVGHPVAVNPDKKLARLAQQKGWQVMQVG